MEIVYDDRVAKHPFESLDELDHAYAVTVHKCQGNEFRCVVLVVMDTPSALLYRNLLYTAVTRAKEMLILVGDGAKIVRMIGNKTKVKRFFRAAPHAARTGSRGRGKRISSVRGDGA